MMIVRRVNALAGIVIVAAATGCRTIAVRPPTVPVAPAVPAATAFITTFWCGPPLELFDDARAAEIAVAGFNVVGAPCEGEMTPEWNRRALDTAARHGLRMWVRDARYDERARERPDWQAGIAAAVAEYQDHPAFGGYFVTDEPSVRQFDDLAAIVDEIRRHDPDGLTYVNMPPDFVFRAGDPAYEEYVDRFISALRPQLLSFDHYPFGEGGKDRPTFFTNLALVRERALRHRVPFLFIGLAMPHGPYRDPTEAEIAWQMLHALAYGARGISYFAYWTPTKGDADVMKYRRGLVEHGQPTSHYFEAMRLNRLLDATVRELEGFHSVGVADSAGMIAPALPLGPVAAIDGGPVTVGLFEDVDQRQMAVLVNRDYGREVTIRVRPSESGIRLDRFDPVSVSWSPMASDRLRLAGGAGALIRRAAASDAIRP